MQMMSGMGGNFDPNSLNLNSDGGNQGQNPFGFDMSAMGGMNTGLYANNMYGNNPNFQNNPNQGQQQQKP